MVTYAEMPDVAVRLGRDPGTLDPNLASLITVRIADAERMIRRAFRDAGKDLDDAVTSGDVDPEDVKQVEAEAVLRLARNPDGYLSEGDGSYQYQLMQDVASGVLQILPDEWDMLGINPSGMFIIAPSPVRAS